MGVSGLGKFARMFEELLVLRHLLVDRKYLLGVAVDVVAFHAAKLIGMGLFGLLVPYGVEVYDDTVYAALALLVFSLNFGSQTELVENYMKPKLVGARPQQAHNTSRLAFWGQTVNLGALLVIASLMPAPVEFIMFVVCTASMLALVGFQSVAERWLDESERRPLFKANWQLIFLPAVIIALFYYGDKLLDLDIFFDPFTSISYVFAPVMFTFAFYRMRGVQLE